MVRTVKSREKSLTYIILVIGIFVIMSYSFLAIAGNFGNSDQANLQVNDTTDSIAKYSICTDYCATVFKFKGFSDSNIYFYANFTNMTNSIVNASNGNGVCQIRFNQTGSYTGFSDMIYNYTLSMFEYNATSNYKGNLMYQINCNSTFGNISLNDSYFITNSNPYIFKTISGIIDFNVDGNPDILSCSEDSLCSYNFTKNVSEDDFNDVLTFGYRSNSNTTLTNFTINSSSGVLEINITKNNEAGSKVIELTVDDNDAGLEQSAILQVGISPVNDAPYFVNLSYQNMTWAQGLFNYLIYAEDEEDDLPYTFNISFLNCTVAQWSTRNCSDPIDMQLFNSSQYSFNSSLGLINISFDPDRNDVGNYTINFTVTDLNNSVSPYNASFSQIVIFEVVNVNSPPNITYLCDNERSTNEGDRFLCNINVTDIDETENITISIDNLDSPATTFFRFNGSVSTMHQVVNSTTGFNASFLINFTTADNEVGDWLIRFTTTDSSGSENLSFIDFVVYNSNDSVSLSDINITNLFYTSSAIENYFINASDDDLLIQNSQKSLYNESLIFSTNVSWMFYNVSAFTQGNNYLTARFSIYPNISGIGGHYVNISVRDFNNFSTDSFVLFVNVTNNSVPVWNETFASNTIYALIEDTNFYLNLTANVSDIDGDLIVFNYTVNDIANTSFNSLVTGFNLSRGIINITPTDFDVGRHNITIYAIDFGKNSLVPLNFLFIVNNTHDNPYVKYFSCNSGCNGSSNILLGNINLSEDTPANFDLSVQDNDFRINVTQRAAFYDENITLVINISGPNRNLFTYSISPINDNETIFGIPSFTPNKSDVGDYNISINVTDRSNRSTFILFNITIFENEHPPEVDDVLNSNLSIYESFILDVNSTDAEDGNESSQGIINVTYFISNLTNGGNFLSINMTTGIISNSTSLVGKAGIWNYSIFVNDTTNRNDSDYFLLYIFDEPVLNNSFTDFNMVENISYMLNLSANHSVGSDLTYKISINGYLRNITVEVGNGVAFYWNFTSNFSDETTCSGFSNFTINVSNQKLSSVYTWNLTVNHTNYPSSWNLDLIGGGDQIVEESKINLDDYFVDMDADDGCNNQTIGFNAVNLTSQTLTITINNWTNGSQPNMTFAGSAQANYSITAFEYDNGSAINNISANNFTVSIASDEVEVPTPSSSSGGGSSRSGGIEYRPVSLRIIVPDPTSVGTKDKVVLPLTLENDGEINLNNIALYTSVALDGNLTDAIKVNLSQYNFTLLKINQSLNLTLTAEIDTENQGLYEINIYANVSSPVYSDSSKIYLNVREGTSFDDKIIFTEELIVNNPECAEIQEIVDEARNDFTNGDVREAQRKIDLAINSCKQAISEKPSPIIREVLRGFGISNYILVSIGVALSLGFLYYFYKRFMFSRAIKIEEDL